LIANLLTWKRQADGVVGDGFTSEYFTASPKRENEHSGFQPVNGMARCLLDQPRARDLPCKVKRRRPMEHSAITRLHEPVPLSTAMLSHLALSLFLWNITLRIAGLLLAA
jgi:hypothetical protein